MSRRARRAGVGLAVAVAGALGAASPAQARSSAVVPYASSEVWPAAIRFLRVDRAYRIKEKDEPAGYVLFELPENKRTYRAALEMVKTIDEDGRTATQLTCTIADLPRRYEVTLLEQLSAKVRDERGPPPPPPSRPPVAGDPPPKEPKPDGKPEPKPDPGDLSELPKPPTWGPAPR